MLTHRNLTANIVQVEGVFRCDEGDVLLAVLPYFHIYGLTVNMNFALARGATVVTMARFDLEAFLEAIERHRVTRAFLVPPILLALAKHPLVDRHDLSSLDLIVSGAAPLDERIARAVAERIGCRVVQGYGLTETSPVTHLPPEGPTWTPSRRRSGRRYRGRSAAPSTSRPERCSRPARTARS